MKYASGEDVLIGDVVGTRFGEHMVLDVYSDRGGALVCLTTSNPEETCRWTPNEFHAGVKLLLRAPTPTHYASGNEIRIGDVALVNGRCVIIERIDALGLAGRYSGSDDAWAAGDAGGLRLLGRDRLCSMKPIERPQEQAAGAGKLDTTNACLNCREKPCACEERVWAVWNVTTDQWSTSQIVRRAEAEKIASGRRSDPVFTGETFEVRRYRSGTTSDPYISGASEQEIGIEMALRDAFGADYRAGVRALLEATTNDKKLPAKLRAAIAVLAFTDEDVGREHAVQILNPKVPG